MLALSLAATGAMAQTAGPDGEPKRMFAVMTRYLADQDALSFAYDATLDVVTTDMMKVGLASSGTLTLRRPDKLRMTRVGIADLELAYDGKTVAAIARDRDVYARMPMEGSLDTLIDTLRTAYGVEAPAADLMSVDAFPIMMDNVVASRDLGSGVIGGEICNHLAFRTRDTDWEIWIADGETPRPCRITITSRMMAMAPSYTVQVSNWKVGADVAADDFRLRTGTAKEVEIGNLPGLDDLAGLLEDGDQR